MSSNAVYAKTVTKPIAKPTPVTAPAPVSKAGAGVTLPPPTPTPPTTAAAPAQMETRNHDRGMYVGASYLSWMGSNSNDLATDKSPSASGVTLRLGYDINRHWAVEGRYNTAQYKRNDSYISGTRAIGSEEKINSPGGFYGKYTHPIGSVFAPYVVVGMSANKSAFTQGGSSSDTIQINPSAGIGMELAISQQVKATAEFTYLGKVDDVTVTGLNAGLRFKF